MLYYPHFRAKETKVLQIQTACPGHRARHQQDQNSSPGLPYPRAPMSSHRFYTLLSELITGARQLVEAQSLLAPLSLCAPR